MIAIMDYENLCKIQLGRDISSKSNLMQNHVVTSSPKDSLFIVAGPGSGKTTVLTLKVLKLILVDDIEPSTILVTTFTKKAAAELRSRLLGWGDKIKQSILSDQTHSKVHSQINSIDFNQITTGTLDSIAEQMLTDNRPPGQPSPVVIEDFVANALMTRAGLFTQGRHQNDDLKDYLKRIRGSAFGLNVPSISQSLRGIKDRVYHDFVDVPQYLSNIADQGAIISFDAIHDYEAELGGRLLYDFAHIEKDFNTRISNGELDQAISKFKFLLVDEYQDTNLLQEEIYFGITRHIIQNNGSITVVGDDDQSLYRFRGATVDLFQNFQSRINTKLGLSPSIIYLSTNYRSTNKIVDFCNNFSCLDTAYQTARVAGKPAIQHGRQGEYTNYPVIGLFRDDINTLASDLTNLLNDVINGKGFKFTDNEGIKHNVRVNKQGGSAGDIALLTGSPREFNYSGDPRLPHLLRNNLQSLNQSVLVFNPRGQELRLVDSVQIICGLMLLCIDPYSNIQNSINRMPQEAVQTFNAWRGAANNFIQSNPLPHNPSLQQFVTAWGNRVKLDGSHWSARISIIDLLYKLVTWIEYMQSDIEGLVYLESITRTITQSALFSGFSGELIIDRNQIDLEESSIREAMWNIFVPLATGAVDTNEDLLDTLPRNRMNIMSIHQSKGLEFPFVIVDVGSDFRTNHASQANKRFPRNGGEPCNMEDEYRNYSPLGVPARSGIDRAFDDLIRQYFVAYSRAQDILLLVGLTSVSDGYETPSGSPRNIPNIATGWDRNNDWKWGQGLSNLIRI